MALTTPIKGHKTADGNLTANSFINSTSDDTYVLLGGGGTSLLSGIGGATNLIGLSDVNTSTPTDKFFLIADGVDWESRALLTADISDWATQVEAYITDAPAIALLINASNWDIDGIYTGTAITNTFQGQKHYSTSYFFEAYDDNLWLRVPRG